MLSVVTTADGSKTLFCPRYQQTYHSTHGALTESRHVFIQSSHLAAKLNAANHLHLLEIGFGTGLNYLLAAQLAEQTNTFLHYTALEQNILPQSLLASLDYGGLLNRVEHNQALLAHLDTCGDIKNTPLPVFHYKNTQLQIHPNQASLFPGKPPYFDIVFLDAFSPQKNAELWSCEFIKVLYSHLNDGAVLATYSTKGDVRRAMQACGFRVTKLPGPPGKREILVAEK